jgi:Xaa-Pro aminopeptidase
MQQNQLIATCLARRQALASQLAPGIVIIPTTQEIARNADTTYPFRFDSSFYYLTGFTEPDAVFVQIIGENQTQNILFCRDSVRRVWGSGPRKATMISLTIRCKKINANKPVAQDFALAA